MSFDLPKDTHMLLGVINMNLRDHYPDFEKLCLVMGVEGAAIEKQLNDAGYFYDGKSNQFHKV